MGVSGTCPLDPGPWDCGAYIQVGPFYLSHFFLETPSQTRSEVCFRGDFRSSQVEDEEEPSPRSPSWLFTANRVGDPPLTHWSQSPSPSRLKSGVGGSHEDPALNFLRDFHTIFQNGRVFTFSSP